MFNNNSHTLTNRLRTDLLAARKARDQLTSSTLQGLISAIDNAGAIPTPEGTVSIGVGSTEALRRELSEHDLQKIIKSEITELKQAIKMLNNEESSYAHELRDKIVILKRYL